MALGDTDSWSNGGEEIPKWPRGQRHEVKETLSLGNAFTGSFVVKWRGALWRQVKWGGGQEKGPL